jgi:cytochrome c oxidase subunit 2
MTKVDSHTVLWGQTIMYTAYCLAIISVMAWFAVRITKPRSSREITPRVFYVWVGFLVILGVSLHLFTYNTIPWVKDDLHGSKNFVAAYDISVGDHKFAWGEGNPQLQVPCGKLVKFSVTSTDLTYGFGLFRSDNSMVMQMQVVPGHANDLVWTFEKDGVYSIRSTEYSGPLGYQMVEKDAVKVTGCGQVDTRALGATR